VVDRPTGAPLGKYHLAQDEVDAEIRQVQLLGVPIELFFQTRQQHDELIREFAVLGLGHGELDASLPPELRHLIQELGLTFTRAEVRANEEVEAAARAGLPTMDLHYLVPATVVDGADRLEALMARADELCTQGLMLTMPRTPAMLAFSAWWLGELRGQVAGRPAMPWAAPNTP
jgi:hypothetical protein